MWKLLGGIGKEPKRTADWRSRRSLKKASEDGDIDNMTSFQLSESAGKGTLVILSWRCHSLACRDELSNTATQKQQSLASDSVFCLDYRLAHR